MNATVWLLAFGLLLTPGAARAVTIGDICRVKGQEENELMGVGLVSGLNGTGDGDLERTRQMLARQIQLLSDPLSKAAVSAAFIESLKTPNVAMVLVTATVPAEGAQRGGRIDCVISAPNAKSLEGGYLLPTHLTSTIPGDGRIYAVCSGKVELEDSERPAVGVIEDGCQMEADFETPYLKDNVFTLILRQPHAGFHMANEVEFEVNKIIVPSSSTNDLSSGGRGMGPVRRSQARLQVSERLAKALDSRRIVVPIPPEYVNDHSQIEFIQGVLKHPFTTKPLERARVRINERTGVIVVGADVEIGAVIVSAKGFRVSTGDNDTSGAFVELDPSSDTATTKLQALVDALNALKAPDDDIIDIVKELHELGAIYGEVVIQ